MQGTRLLNKQNAKAVLRLSQIVSVLTLAGAAIIYFFVNPPSWSIPKVDAVVEQRPDLHLTYPPYSFFTSRRLDIFSYGEQSRAPRVLVKERRESALHTLPGPNATGLTLLATMPGKKDSYVVVKGLEGSGESLVPLGEKIRDSLLAKIDSDGIVLTKNAQNTTLLLNTPWRSEADILLKRSNIPIKGAFSTYAFSPAGIADDYATDAGLDLRELGLFMVPLTREEREELELGPDTGLRITGVVRPDLEVRPGDLLVAASGRPVGKVEQIVELLRQTSATDINLTLIRSGKPINVRVTAQ